MEEDERKRLKEQKEEEQKNLYVRLIFGQRLKDQKSISPHHL